MQRNIKLIATLSVLLAIAAFGCGKPGGTSTDSPFGGSTSAGASTSAASSGLTAAVQSKLKGDADLAEVKVSEQNGSIQLDGTVKDSATKDKAEKIVMDVEKDQNSTVGVLNNLQIKEAGATK